VGSIVSWNGAALPTTVVSASRVTALVPATNLVTGAALTTALVTVARPDGAVSAASPFSILGAIVAGATAGPIDPGASRAISNASLRLPGGAVTATLTNNAAASGRVDVTVATYSANPVAGTPGTPGTPGTTFSSGGFFDLQVIGADATDAV